jgi:rare lipoprotein A
MRRIVAALALAVSGCASPGGYGTAPDLTPQRAKHIHDPKAARQPVTRVRPPSAPRGGGVPLLASFYGGGPRAYEPNSRTASGELFNQWGLTAASRTLPLGTRLLVSRGGRSVVVRVNDRGPAAWTGRSLDLSRGAARAIGIESAGVATVQTRIIR